ncbi:hypothetical protein NKI48_03190 [Mesorhizobium sp. M0644]|uniref:hypothetical protein n=1 Tax=Mesorhizobium sp. M0644 TaxID=2956979 RepID=UPI003335300A
MTLTLDYEELTAAQKLRACWHDFCDADPVPPEFAEDMERAGYAELVSVDADALDDPFAYERGIIPGGSMWQLTEAGRAALQQEPQP